VRSRFCVRRDRDAVKSIAFASRISIRSPRSATDLETEIVEMTRNTTRKGLVIATAALCLALGAAQSNAMGSGGASGSQSGDLAPSASPYAILAPITVERTPGGEGRAAFEGVPASSSAQCPAGQHVVTFANGGEWRCRFDR
jgi:hypothetical protein